MNGFLSDVRRESTSKRVLMIYRIAALLLVLAVVLLSAFLVRSNKVPEAVRVQIVTRINSDVNAAIDRVNKLDRVVTSRTAYDIGKIRQYIYSAEQLNGMHQTLFGTGLISSEMLSQLYTDLDRYETLTQSAKTSTMDAQQVLLDDLQRLKTVLE